MGRAYVFGDWVDTDVLPPGSYLRLPAKELARHHLESVDPELRARYGPATYRSRAATSGSVPRVSRRRPRSSCCVLRRSWRLPFPGYSTAMRSTPDCSRFG